MFQGRSFSRGRGAEREGSRAGIRATVPKHALVMTGALLALTGCGGGGTKTVTVSTPAPTSSTTPTAETTTPSGLTRVSGRITVQKVRHCLATEGASVQKLKPLGPGRGVFAVMPNGSDLGVVIAPNRAVANELARQLADQPEMEVNRTKDADVLVTFRGSVDAGDRSLAAMCVK
jgi:hypothetical protein